MPACKLDNFLRQCRWSKGVRACNANSQMRRKNCALARLAFTRLCWGIRSSLASVDAAPVSASSASISTATRSWSGRSKTTRMLKAQVRLGPTHYYHSSRS